MFNDGTCCYRSFGLPHLRSQHVSFLVRSTPGLRPGHLAALDALASISKARFEGGVVGSAHVTFHPLSPVQCTEEGPLEVDAGTGWSLGMGAEEGVEHGDGDGAEGSRQDLFVNLFEKGKSRSGYKPFLPLLLSCLVDFTVSRCCRKTARKTSRPKRRSWDSDRAAARRTPRGHCLNWFNIG